jgi:hypothetical protein
LASSSLTKYRNLPKPYEQKQSEEKWYLPNIPFFILLTHFFLLPEKVTITVTAALNSSILITSVFLYAIFFAFENNPINNLIYITFLRSVEIIAIITFLTYFHLKVKSRARKPRELEKTPSTENEEKKTKEEGGSTVTSLHFMDSLNGEKEISKENLNLSRISSMTEVQESLRNSLVKKE